MKNEEYRKLLLEKFLPFLDQDPTEWVKEWKSACNLKTGYVYRGITGFILNSIILPKLNTDDPRFASFNDILSFKNAHIKKGEKAIFYTRSDAYPYWDLKQIAETKEIKCSYTSWNKRKQLLYKEPDRYIDALRSQDVIIPEWDNKEITLTRQGCHHEIFPIWHASQLEGIPKYVKEETNIEKISLNEFVLNSAEGMQVPVKEDGENSAYYTEKDDSIHIPIMEMFKNDIGLNVTVLHELGHATGVEKRLNRESLKRYHENDDFRAKEEFVAEMTALILRNDAQIELNNIIDLKNHKAYLQHWKQFLNDGTGKTIDELFRNAEKSSNYIRTKELEIEKKKLREIEEKMEEELEKEKPVKKEKERELER